MVNSCWFSTLSILFCSWYGSNALDNQFRNLSTLGQKFGKFTGYLHQLGTQFASFNDISYINRNHYQTGWLILQYLVFQIYTYAGWNLYSDFNFHICTVEYLEHLWGHQPYVWIKRVRAKHWLNARVLSFQILACVE